MIDRFEIIASDSQRPDAERIIFCDGSGGSLFRNGTDLELSHWRPNRTPAAYRAGTSTEICFRFLAMPAPPQATVRKAFGQQRFKYVLFAVHQA